MKENNIFDELRKILPESFTETGSIISTPHQEEKFPGEPNPRVAHLFATGIWEGKEASASVTSCINEDGTHDDPTLNIYFGGQVLVRENGKEILCEVPF